MEELSAFLGKSGDAIEFYGYVRTDVKKRNAILYKQAVVRIQELKEL